MVQRIREAERNIIYDEYVNREQDIITGVVQRQEAGNVFIDLGKTEAILAPTEQMPGEEHRPHDRIKAYIVEVKKQPKDRKFLFPGLILVY